MGFLEQSTQDQRAVGAVPAGLHRGAEFESSLVRRHANGQFGATAQRDDQPRFGTDPAGLDESVDGYHEEKVPFYGGLSRMVNRNDAAVVATGVNGEIVYRSGEFREGYGTIAKSGRFLRAGRSTPRAGVGV